MNSAATAPPESRSPVVEGAAATVGPLKQIDYAELQQCMHCGMCLPTCPTYDATKLERNSPRGRIALMRAIADGRMEPTKTFGEEMYFCLGCLACETACPAGVEYAHLFEMARSEAEQAGVLANPKRSFIRASVLRGLFTRPRLLRLVGRMLWLYQAFGAQAAFRALRLNRLLPARYRNLEAQTPVARARFSHQLIAPVERPENPSNPPRRVALLTGCVQDIVFSDINRDTADVLLANGCEVVTPPVQFCCGSLHGHNGDMETSRALARCNLKTIDPFQFDAIITNAAGCGSHLKHYDRLLADDAECSAAAAEWSKKARDISEYLVEIGFRPPAGNKTEKPVRATYHEACHLCHGQKISAQPRAVLASIPGFEWTELKEATWCCGSAGVYNITQPEMAAELQQRKTGHIENTRAEVVATANPGCHLQLQNGLAAKGVKARVAHPVALLAEAYRHERHHHHTENPQN